MLQKDKFYINAEWVAPTTHNTIEVINPSDAKPFAHVSLAGQDDVNKAVQSAKIAFNKWSKTTIKHRLELLQKLKEIYKSRAEEMGYAISSEMGAPIDMATSLQVGAGAVRMSAFLKVLQSFDFAEELKTTTILKEPIGVCALITPWNWPMNQIVLKVIPALAAGCTVVLKPSEVAPLSAMLFAEFIDQAGFPAGVFNLINGDGETTGTKLVQHKDVSMVSFTGSTRAGIAISKNVAEQVKRVSLELGGKGANILFSDAPDKSIVTGVRHCFINSGQSCNAPTRMLVERSIYQKVLEIAADTAHKTTIDIASKSGRHIGPVATLQQYEKVQELIQSGIDEGAKLLVGGVGKPNNQEHGYFVKPTVFTDVKQTMRIAKEEIFGPVLVIIPFDSEQEAIDIANDTEYGLANYIQTADNQLARRVARQLKAGMVEINGNPLDADAPFGGYKFSGNGREGGKWGIEEYLEIKAISGYGNI